MANVEEFKKFYSENKSRVDLIFKEHDPVKFWTTVMELSKNSILVNSWHRNEFESAAMWKIFLRSHEGVAVQSSFRRLCDSFKQSSDEIKIGVVNYLDYSKDKIPHSSVFGFVTHKIKSYAHENELRAVIHGQTDDKLTPLYEVGKYIPVDLNVLIEKIYVSPNAPDWYCELVNETIRSLGYNFMVETSSLRDKSLH